MAERNYLLTQETALYKLQRMALEIAEQLTDTDDQLYLVGVMEKGMVIAREIADLLKEHYHGHIGLLSLSMNKSNPGDVSLSSQVDFNNSHIILIDDVANSGKTLLYGLKPLLDYHPRKIQTLVLVERMHKQFPVKPDFVGISVATTLQNNICVTVKGGKIAGAYLE
jgi:pyrimidine operon attenuation protein / uracil phosphoribosyltransferase